MLWGLHWIDMIIIGLYLAGVLYIGRRLSRRVQGETDFYLAGRKLGKFTQFFLNFSAMTEASSAASVTSIVFRQGASGVWLHMQLVFVTPFYWFFTKWFRRARLISTGDIFVDRFDSKLLAGLYALYGIVITTLFVGFGYLASAKTLQAVLVKPESAYTVTDQQKVNKFHEYIVLKKQYSENRLNEDQEEQYRLLDNLYQTGKLKGYVSYLPDGPVLFYLIYGICISMYVISGGFPAAAVTSIFQGVLIIAFSVLLIPLGLVKLGGFTGLHKAVPLHMFEMLSTSDMSEFNAYSILSMVLLGIVGYCGGVNVMSASGSARDELSAQVGVVTGALCKRVMTVAWMVCGLLAVGLYKGILANADESWGMLTKGVLGIGGMGIMIAGILAANMSSMDGTSVNISGLFVRNIYAPLLPGRPETHYVRVGRIGILAILSLGIVVAMNTSGIVPLIKVSSAINAMFGAVVLLAFVWRGLTRRAVVYTSLLFLLVIVVTPVVVPCIAALKTSPGLTVRTPERTIVFDNFATEEDVTLGLADHVGDLVQKKQLIASAAVYFEKVLAIESKTETLVNQGTGRFHVELYLASCLGFAVEHYSKAGMLATRFTVNALFPIVLLIGFSLLTRQTTPQAVMDRFYAKMKTPVAMTPEADLLEVKRSCADPGRYDQQRLFPWSRWEFCKWTDADWLGFSLSWVAVGTIVLLLKIVLLIGQKG